MRARGHDSSPGMSLTPGEMMDDTHNVHLFSMGDLKLKYFVNRSGLDAFGRACASEAMDGAGPVAEGDARAGVALLSRQRWCRNHRLFVHGDRFLMVGLCWWNQKW